MKKVLKYIYIAIVEGGFFSIYMVARSLKVFSFWKHVDEYLLWREFKEDIQKDTVLVFVFSVVMVWCQFFTWIDLLYHLLILFLVALVNVIAFILWLHRKSKKDDVSVNESLNVLRSFLKKK